MEVVTICGKQNQTAFLLFELKIDLNCHFLKLYHAFIVLKIYVFMMFIVLFKSKFVKK